VTIEFDYSLNCSVAPGSLAGMTEIGFHSGANQWSAVVDWDAATAVTAANDGNDIFSVTVAPGDYYGIALADLETIYFVFNQGPATPGSPWDSEGKDEVDGACADFFVTIADLAACVSSTVDFNLANSLTVKPNPFSEMAVITFDNPNNKVYDVTVTTLTGQVVKTLNGVAGNSIELQRENLTAGMYFINFVSEAGKTATTKMIVQ
ncbi:MAG: T9SS type A sorting domain-containing protein, partial [Phaeodactylibacter sp.]|nr:T9SS type A sorting domain-containing protein [Phaeodactylibacter sp.]